jgi:iron(III) transport system ATP-binding protein
MHMAPDLQIDALTVRYPESNSESPAVRGLSLNLAAGEIACLLGPSGCGKSSLLRAVAGFVTPATGQIRLGDQLVFGPGVNLAPEKRGVGMVFQDYALFPHLSLKDNILFGLTAGRPKSAGSEESLRVETLVELVGLRGYEDRFPHEISGGQAQRVALARALAPKPRLLLLDEPFSNLDPNLRARLAREVREILREAEQTAVLVTHDQSEAFAMADQLGVMFNGYLAQWGTPYDVYHEPCIPEVAKFIGEGALITGLQNQHSVETAVGQLPLAPCCCNESASNKEVRVLLRPDDVIHDDDSPLQARVIRKSFRGADFLYTLELPGGEQVLSLVPSHHDHPLDAPIGIRLEADHVITLPASQPIQAFEKSTA